MKGIQDLIRPCATLARYEAALTAGTITQDVMVFIADVRQIRWKGEIYDCSVTAVTEDGKIYIHADGFNSENDEYYYLPNSAPDDDPAHTFAMLSDLQNAGGVSQEDFDALYDGVVEAEEVTAAALNDLNDRLGKLAENVQGETVTKEEFETAVSDLNESLSGKADAQKTSEALTALSGQVETLSRQVETAVTSEQLSSAVDNVNNTILENEEVTAAALNDLNSRIKEIITRLNNAGL